MTNKNYVSGRNFEYKVKKYLESKSYLVVRSAGSHSIADLIAFKEFTMAYPMLIQCKYHGMNKKEMLRIGKSLGHYVVDFYAVTTEKRKMIFYRFMNDDDNPMLMKVNL